MSLGSTLSTAATDGIWLRNLVIQNNPATPLSKIDITADAMAIEDFVTTSFSATPLTVDITVVGANGRDSVTAEAADTWYYIFVIAKPDGTNTAGLFSTSSTAPTMPSGYTKKRRVGAVRNDSGSDFLRYVQEGNHVVYWGRYYGIAAGQSVAWTNLDFSGTMPPTSQLGGFEPNIIVTDSTAGKVFNVSLKHPDLAAGSHVGNLMNIAVANQQQSCSTYCICPTNSSQQVAYQIAAVPSGGGGAYIYHNDYYDRI